VSQDLKQQILIAFNPTILSSSQKSMQSVTDIITNIIIITSSTKTYYDMSCLFVGWFVCP